LTDIRIKHSSIYDFRIKAVNIRYDRYLFLRGVVAEVALELPEVSLDLGQKGILEFVKYLNVGKKASFLVNRVRCTHAALNIKSSDLTLEGNASFDVSLMSRLINSVEIRITSLKTQNLLVDSLFFKVQQGASTGVYEAKSVKFDKLAISDLKSGVTLNGRIMVFNPLIAKVLSGNIQGNMTFRLGSILAYAMDLDIYDLSLERMVEDFQFAEKFTMRGKLGGKVVVKGSGSTPSVLNGELNAGEQGGNLTITDMAFLENLAKDSKQDVNLIIESFKNYQFSKGDVSLYLAGNNLILEVSFEGAQGKRNLTVALHNFTLGR
jgi:hypothetical protein